MQLTFRFTGIELLAAMQPAINAFTKDGAAAKAKKAKLKEIDVPSFVSSTYAPLLAELMFVSERIDKTATYDLSLAECLQLCIIPGTFETKKYEPA